MLTNLSSFALALSVRGLQTRTEPPELSQKILQNLETTGPLVSFALTLPGVVIDYGVTAVILYNIMTIPLGHCDPN